MNAYDLRCSWCDLKCRDRGELAAHEGEHRREEAEQEQRKEAAE